MVAKLNQIIAIEKGVKARTYGAITEMHKVGQKAEMFNGFVRRDPMGEMIGKKGVY